MLNICSRYPHVYELFVDSPTLFWLLFMSVQNNSRNEIEFVELCRQKRTKILQFMGFPPTKSALKFINKIHSSYYRKYEYGLIREVFIADFEYLNHRARVPISLLTLVAECPSFIHSSLLRQLNNNECDLDTVKNLIKCIQHIQSTIYYKRNKFEQFIYSENCSNSADLPVYNEFSFVLNLHPGGYCIGRDPEIYIYKCMLKDNENMLMQQLLKSNTINDIQRLYAKSVDQVRKMKKTAELGEIFPVPPLQNTSSIIAIKTYQELQQEGEQQDNCIVDYYREIVEGRYFVCKILKPERATLGVFIEYIGEKLQLKLDEVKRYRNQEVDFYTEESVLNWLKRKARHSRFVRSTNDDNQYIDPQIFYKYKKAFEKYKKSHKHINLDFSSYKVI